MQRLTPPAPCGTVSNGREERLWYDVFTGHRNRIKGNVMPESETMRRIRLERVRKMTELLKIRYDKIRNLPRPLPRHRRERWIDPSSHPARDSKQDRDLR